MSDLSQNNQFSNLNLFNTTTFLVMYDLHEAITPASQDKNELKKPKRFILNKTVRST